MSTLTFTSFTVAATVASGCCGWFPCCRGPTLGVAANTWIASLLPAFRSTFSVTSAFPPAATLIGSFAAGVRVNGASPRTASASPGPRSIRVMVGLFGGGWLG